MSKIISDSLTWFGVTLRGEFLHYCPDWDGLPIDETTTEFAVCHCYDDDPKNSEAVKRIQRVLWTEFETADLDLIHTKISEFLWVLEIAKTHCHQDTYVNLDTEEIMCVEEYNQELYNPTGIRLEDFVNLEDWIWENLLEG